MEDSKYQVGDTVTIKQLSLDGGYRFSINGQMVALSGKSFKIKDIRAATSDPGRIPDDGYRYKLEEEPGDWSWASSMFEDSNGSTASISAFIRKKKCPTLDFSL